MLEIKILNWKPFLSVIYANLGEFSAQRILRESPRVYVTKANMLLYFNYVATQNSINLQFEDESVENLEMSMGMIDLCIALSNYAWHLAQSSTVLRWAPYQSEAINCFQITSACITTLLADLNAKLISSRPFSHRFMWQLKVVLSVHNCLFLWFELTHVSHR